MLQQRWAEFLKRSNTEILKDEINISTSGLAWKRFRSNPVSLVSLVVIILIAMTALAGYLICPDKSPQANTQHLELAAKKPGFTVTMLKIRKNKAIRTQGPFRTLLYGKESAWEFVPILDYRFSGDSLIVRNYTEIPQRENVWQLFYMPDVVYPLNEHSVIGENIGGLSFKDINGKEITTGRAKFGRHH